MKKVILSIACFCSLSALHAQKIVDPKDVAKEAGANTANGDIRGGIDNAASKANNELKGLFKKKKKTDEKKADPQTPAQPAAPAPVAAAPAPVAPPVAAAPAASTGMGAYSNYDFVPGDRIVFEDNFADDMDGEFPAHWQLGAGQGVLNKLGDREVLMLTEGNYAKVSPLIKSPSYLTDTFTIEFDSYTTGGYAPHIFFYSNADDAKHGSNDLFMVDMGSGNGWGEVEVADKKDVKLNALYPSEIRGEKYYNKWHHVAITYRHNQVKVYVDQYRVLSVPNIPASPHALDIEGIGDSKTPIMIANFRIANGGSMNMWNKKVADAKIVTHGINFDIDKATIKPESMGTLNMILKVMTDNPTVKYEIDGHTDNSGAAAHNLALSQQRAEAVKAQLVSMGIDASRLTTKGLGDTKPLSANSTPEGKANNRRVEFIKK